MSNPRHWLEFAEYTFLVASVLGTAITLLSGQAIYMALPMSVSLLLNLINRLRLEQQMKRRITTAMLRLQEEISEDILSLENQVLDQLSQSKQLILPYSPRAQETPSIVPHQVREEITVLQTQIKSCLSQLEALHLQPTNKDIAGQKRSLALLQDQYANLEKSLSEVMEYLKNNSSLPTRVNYLEQELGQISAAIADLQNQINYRIDPKINLSEPVTAIQVASPESVENQTQSPLSAPVAPLSGSPVTLPSLTSSSWRCIYTLNGHSDWVRSLAISPDGKTLVSGSFDKTIKLWHLPDGQLIDTLSKHSKGVFSVVITPDGQTLASGSWDETIKLWQLDTGKLIHTLTNHSGSVRSLAIAPDGETLISGSFDATIKLWSLKKRQLISVLTESAGQVYAIALSPDGQTLASGGEDGIITLWRLDTCKQLAILTGNSVNAIYRASTIWSLVISPDGETLACGSGDGTIKLWQIYTRELLGIFHGHSGQVMSLVISPNGQTLSSGSVDGTIKLWHLSTGQQLCTLKGDSSTSVVSIAIDSHGKTLASGNVDGIINVWRQD